MVDEQQQTWLSKLSYRELAHQFAISEEIVRHLMADCASDGNPPKRVLHSDYLARQESEVPQDSIRYGIQVQLEIQDQIRQRMEHFKWVESPTPKLYIVGSKTDPEKTTNGKEQEGQRGRRRRNKKDPPPTSGNGDRGSE